MLTERIADLGQFLEVVDRLNKEGLHCFRGQGSASWSLVPSLYRGLPAGLDPEAIGRVERDVYRQFSLRVRGLALPTLRGAWEELAVAQHHGVPTRFLDWTRSPLVALYFALAEDHNDDAAVWSVNMSAFPFPAGLGRAQPSGAHRIENVEHFLGAVPTFLRPVSVPPVAPTPDQRATLVVFEAPAVIPRLSAQQGLFSAFVSNTERLVSDHRAVVEEAECQLGRSLLRQLVIPRPLVETVRNQLPIEPASIFPDIEGLALTLRLQARRQLGELRGPP